MCACRTNECPGNPSLGQDAVKAGLQELPNWPRRPLTEESVSDDVVISQELVNGTAVLTVRGEIDVASAPELRTHLHEVCTTDASTVTVDLRAVTFLDSSALGVLVGALGRCRENKSDLRLIINSPRLLRIFDITGLTSVFDISETL
jgi:anti-sigma B factor antagonist